jgi:hypothetical protein
MTNTSVSATLRFFEKYGNKISYNKHGTETGKLKKNKDGTYTFTYTLESIKEPFVREFEYLNKKTLRLYKHKFSEHGAQISWLDGF